MLYSLQKKQKDGTFESVRNATARLGRVECKYAGVIRCSKTLSGCVGQAFRALISFNFSQTNLQVKLSFGLTNPVLFFLVAFHGNMLIAVIGPY